MLTVIVWFDGEPSTALEVVSKNTIAVQKLIKLNYFFQIEDIAHLFLVWLSARSFTELNQKGNGKWGA